MVKYNGNNTNVVKYEKPQLPEALVEPALSNGAQVTLLLDHQVELLKIIQGETAFNKMTKENKERWYDNMSMIAQAAMQLHVELRGESKKNAKQ